MYTNNTPVSKVSKENDWAKLMFSETLHKAIFFTPYKKQKLH